MKNRVFDAALEIQRFCEMHDFLFCVIGGVALQRWGENRNTNDADLTVITGFGDEERFVELFLGAFQPRIENAKAFALQNRVLLLVANNGVGLDVALGALEFEENAVARATRWQLDSDNALLTCSAEDLIVHKAFANRDQDWIDIKGILIRQQGNLNTPQILEELTPLVELKEDPAILDRLQPLLDAHH
jgi:hypothetical protein